MYHQAIPLHVFTLSHNPPAELDVYLRTQTVTEQANDVANMAVPLVVRRVTSHPGISCKRRWQRPQ